MVVFLNCHFLILNTTRLNIKKKTTRLHKNNNNNKIKDKDHHTFSYEPNLLLNSQPHILFTVIISHMDPIIHKFTTSEKKEERETRI